MPECLLVWERYGVGDEVVVWGYCRLPQGHTGPCGARATVPQDGDRP